jgi:uncharacterized protein (DUF305 family)
LRRAFPDGTGRKETLRQSVVTRPEDTLDYHVAPATSPGGTTPSRARRGVSTLARRPHRAIGTVALLSAVLGLVVAPPALADAPAPEEESAAFEVQFLTMMIDHHQMAVHMSEMCLERAVHDELVELCEEIATSQSAEIQLMQGWLADWYGIDHEPSMDDTAHHEQMEHLATLSGEEFEQAFLEMMIEHHRMAVVEGVDCLRNAGHRELRGLCAGIVGTQLREIVQMQVWLCRWYGRCDFRSPLAA